MINDADNKSPAAADSKSGYFAPARGCAVMKAATAAVLCAVSSLLSGMASVGVGGIIFISVSTALLAYVLTAYTRPWVAAACAAASAAITLLSGAHPIYLVASLAFVLLAFVLSAAVRRRCGLSGTVIALSAAALVITGAAVLILYLAGGENAAALFSEKLSQLSEMIKGGITTAAKSVAGTGTELSESDIDAMWNNMLMMFPSFTVLVYFLFSYITAKIYRLIASASGSNLLFDGGQWPLRAGLPASLLFIACYIVTAFSASASIVYYTAANLLYMLLPAMTVCGFRMMFGQSSAFRRTMSTGGRLAVIGIAVLALWLDFTLLFIVASFFCAITNIRLWYAGRKKDDR